MAILLSDTCRSLFALTFFFSLAFFLCVTMQLPGPQLQPTSKISLLSRRGCDEQGTVVLQLYRGNLGT